MPATASGLRYPASTDTPDVPRDIGNLAADADNRARLVNKAPITGGALFTTQADMVTITHTLITGRLYRATLVCNGSQITNAGIVILRLFVGGTELGRIASVGSAPVGGIVAGTTSVIVTGTGASTIIKGTASSTAASFQVAGGGLAGWITLEDLGT